MKYQILFLILLFVSFSFSSQAQILDRVKRAAERGVNKAVEKRVEAEAEKIAQRQLEKVFSGIYGPEGLPGIDIEKILSGIHADVPVADKYEFTGFSNMLITGQDEMGKAIDPMVFKSFYSESELVMGMEVELKEKEKKEGTSVIIYDFERNASIILFDNDGQKSRIAYAYDFEKMTEGIEKSNADLNNEDAFKLVKTVRSKTILGYECDEYHAEDEDGISSFWITEKTIGRKSGFWGESNPVIAARMKNNNSKQFSQLPQGSMLELDYKSKIDKSEMQMTITELNENYTQRFLMAEYQNVFASSQ
ncbi:DUF4412 domain-containing protein [Cecembia calidifontis]|uniref:Uncharacterized protein DUF4412 n=1 Tax=Cecembia calidifontis TaxID=1187080 RepID=A0A4Q7P9P4_9BACT|nr:DUF4412 domain-containing protein [Cecembia calidifontis]RZS96904.1 uncharacterized protein DUF4412 [Cecembia calidifontis]